MPVIGYANQKLQIFIFIFTKAGDNQSEVQGGCDYTPLINFFKLLMSVLLVQSRLNVTTLDKIVLKMGL